MSDANNILLQQLVDGQTAIFERLRNVETILAEKRGERRVALWFVGVASTVAGAIAGKFFGGGHA